MIILALRTDKPKAELYLYEDKKELGQLKWQAHRELSGTLHKKIEELLQGQSLLQGLSLYAVEGIVCYKGPGSFTGLRIGLAVANTLAYAQNVPIVACRGESWLETGIKDLLAGKNEKIAIPYYDRPAATSAQKS